MKFATASGLKTALLGGLVGLAMVLPPADASAQNASKGSGKPNPASRFDGTWMKDRDLRYSNNPPYTPAAQKTFDSLRPQDDPGARCTESGTPRIMITPYPMQLIAMDNHLLLISEFNHVVRRIWLDEKTHPADPDPSFYGHNVVTWDGDVMVVDSVGFNGKNYLDPAGDLMSDALHFIERWKLVDKDTIQIEFTIDDPKIYTRPWKSVQTYRRKADWKLGEFSCTENNRNNPDDPANPKSLTSTAAPEPNFGR